MQRAQSYWSLKCLNVTAAEPVLQTGSRVCNNASIKSDDDISGWNGPRTRLAPSPPLLSWADWKRKHRRMYSTAKEVRHSAVFAANLEDIERHNREAAVGLHTYTMALNEYSDLTAQAFAARYHPQRPMGWWAAEVVTVTLPQANAAATIDWWTKHAVTPVKNQRNCSSCWSFSTTGAVEGIYAIATRQLRSLSEQQLMDCVEMGNGCAGGTMAAGFGYVHGNGGLDAEADYNYTSQAGTCWVAAAKRHVASIDSFVKVPGSKESQLVAAVMLQPVSVAVAAKGWQHYAKGVFGNVSACGTRLDHGGSLWVSHHRR